MFIAAETRRWLDDSFHPRCLSRVRVINMGEPVELYESAGSSRPGWFEARTQQEKALGEWVAKTWIC
jgi:hypothetical protein